MGNKKSKKPVKMPQKEVKQLAQTKPQKREKVSPPPRKPIDKKELLKSFVFAFVILAVGFFLYSRVLEFDLVFCDDNIFVLDNQFYNQDLNNIANSFKQSIGTSYYRPILNITFILDAQISGTNPSMFHTTNFILHLLGSLLVFITLLRLNYSNMTALIVGLFFTVHPILTPAVSWISGRNDSLITVFILLSFIFLINYLNSDKPYMKVFHYVFHILFFAISMFTKEIGGVFPILALIFIVFYRREKIFNLRIIVLGIGYTVVVMFWYVLRAKSMSGIDNPDTIGFDALLKSYPTVFAMLGKVIAPIRMNPLANFESLSIIAGIALIIVLAALVYFLKDVDRKKVFFGFSWFVLFLAPTLFVRILFVDDFFDYAEHRMYLPFIGLLIIIMELILSRRIDFNHPVLMVVGFVIVSALFVRSYVYVPKIYDRTTFWQNFVDVYPYKSRGYLDLGKAYFSKEDFKKAEELYWMGVERNPMNKNLYIDLAAVYINLNELDKALEVSKKAYAIDPNDPLGNFNLGRAYSAFQMHDSAAFHLELACMRRGNVPQWWVRLGIELHQIGQYEKALQAHIRALQLNPNEVLALTNLGSAYAMLGKFPEAEQAWEKTIELEPRIYDAYINLINSVMQRNPPDKDKARKLVEMMIQNGGELPPDLKGKLIQFGVIKG